MTIILTRQLEVTLDMDSIRNYCHIKNLDVHRTQDIVFFLEIFWSILERRLSHARMILRCQVASSGGWRRCILIDDWTCRRRRRRRRRESTTGRKEFKTTHIAPSANPVKLVAIWRLRSKCKESHLIRRIDCRRFCRKGKYSSALWLCSCRRLKLQRRPLRQSCRKKPPVGERGSRRR